MKTLSRDEAGCRALEAMAKIGGPPVALVRDETIERAFGWIFFAESQPGVRSSGRCPILIVNRFNGQVLLTTTAFFVQSCIAAYEEAVRRNRSGIGLNPFNGAVVRRLLDEVGLCEIWPPDHLSRDEVIV